MKFLGYFIAVVSIVLVWSCNRQEQLSEEVGMQEDNSLSFAEIYNLISDADIERAANPDNPYDYVGRLHFIGIDYVLSRATPQFESIVSEVNDFSATELMTKGAGVATPANILTQEQVDQIIHEAMSFDINIDNMSSSMLKNEVDRLEATITNLFENQENGSYENIKSQIVRYEAQVVSNNSLLESEKRTVLEATSIFRYSTAQWEGAVPVLPVENVPVDIEANKIKWWQWIVIGLADVGGGVAGGAIAPGSGVVAGAVLASSAAAAAFGADIVIGVR